jgi:nitric oxide dioxygenase
MLMRSVIRPRVFSWLPRRTFGSVPKFRLTPQQIQIVKSTIPALEQHGVAITTLFYTRLLEAHPELKNIFNTAHQSTGEQPAALAHAIWAYAANIENPEALKTAISRIGHKHASLGVTADLYPIVGGGLLSAIKKFLGNAVDEPVMATWKAAYQQLANYFIQFENDLYHQAVTTPGGWKGWRKFFISGKARESEEIIFPSISLQSTRTPYRHISPVSLSAFDAMSLSSVSINLGVQPIRRAKRKVFPDLSQKGARIRY